MFISSRYIHSSLLWAVLLLLLGLLQGGQGRRKDVLQGATHEERGGGGVHLGGQPRRLWRQQLTDCAAVAAAGGASVCGAAERQADMRDLKGPEHIFWLLDLLHFGLVLMCCRIAVSLRHEGGSLIPWYESSVFFIFSWRSADNFTASAQN